MARAYASTVRGDRPRSTWIFSQTSASLHEAIAGHRVASAIFSTTSPVFHVIHREGFLPAPLLPRDHYDGCCSRFLPLIPNNIRVDMQVRLAAVVVKWAPANQRAANAAELDAVTGDHVGDWVLAAKL